MPKVWTLVAHPGYFRSLRANVTNPDDRYLLSMAIWNRLQKTDDPTAGAMLVHSTLNRYAIELNGYLLHFELPWDRRNDIDLLGIKPIKI